MSVAATVETLNPLLVDRIAIVALTQLAMVEPPVVSLNSATLIPLDGGVARGESGTDTAFTVADTVIFDSLQTRGLWSSLAGGRVRAYQVWLYAHLPLVIAIAATSVGVRLLVAAPEHAALAAGPRWLFCGALAACLAATGAIRGAAGTCGRAPLNRAIRTRATAAAGFLLLQAALGRALPPLGHMALASAVCAALVLLEVREASRSAAPAR